MASPMRKVKCPTCGAPVAWIESSRFRPFCSERCKQIDLGAWAAEKYKIGGTDEEPPSDETPSSGYNPH